MDQRLHPLLPFGPDPFADLAFLGGADHSLQAEFRPQREFAGVEHPPFDALQRGFGEHLVLLFAASGFYQGGKGDGAFQRAQRPVVLPPVDQRAPDAA